MLVFVTGYRAVLSNGGGAVVLIGIAFLGVGSLDAMHILSCVGMPDSITPNSSQKSIFFWLSARLLAAIALVIFVSHAKMGNVDDLKREIALAVMLGAIGGLSAWGIWWSANISALTSTDQSLSPLAIQIHWLIIAISGLGFAVLWQHRQVLERECSLALLLVFGLSVISEIFSISSGDASREGLAIVADLYKLTAYLHLFHVVVKASISRPLRSMKAQSLREKVTLNCSPNGVLWVDESGGILMSNPAAERLTGYSRDELRGMNVEMLLPPHLRARHSQAIRDYFIVPRSRAMGNLELKLCCKNGQMLQVDIALGHWQEEGVRHAIAYIHDLTDRKKMEESLRYQAMHDELTGLPNRWFFRLQLDQAVARCFRSGMRVAVLFLDLDDFKSINDSFGHSTGDALLAQVGARIRALLREGDTLARLGGDEFAILLNDLVHEEEAVSVAIKVLAELRGSYRVHAQEVYPGGSLGIAFCPEDGRDSGSLLRFADMALYQAKHAGRGTYARYTPQMDRRVQEDKKLHSRLKAALEQGSLQLHYQPQVGVESGEIVGVEALLRWHDAVLGNVSPAQIIPVAEATGLILPLSDWVLESACRQVAAWMQADKPLRVAINISSQQFRQRDLPQKVHDALTRAQVSPEWLEIEITESVAMAYPEQAREQIQALVALGCRVTLDDFGTGYSSLAYLKSLPVSKLKIAKTFLDGVPDNKEDVTICRAIISLAHSLGMTLVAEGVENTDQLEFLCQSECEIYQGWLFSKAVEAGELIAFRKNTDSKTHSL